MQKGAVPTVIAREGRAVQKPKLNLAARVANNSQKKIETLNRIDDVTLKSMNRFYDLEMIMYESGHKKNSYMLKKQISSYTKSLNESKAQRQKTAVKTFVTLRTPSPEKMSRHVTDEAMVPEPPPRPKYGAFLNCDPEAIGSVRRKTKAILASSVSKSMTDLYRLREKHIGEYRQAVADLDKMKSRLELPFIFDVSCRSYTPFTAALPYSPIIISLRKKIKYSENELTRLKTRLQELSRSQLPRSKTAAPPSTVSEEEDVELKPKESTFKIFCEKKPVEPELGDKEQSTLTSRPVTMGATQVPQRRESRRLSKNMKVDLEKLKTEGSISMPMLNLFMNSSKNSHIEIVENPFDTGVLPAQTRSRLLVEAKNDDTMYKWLGFNSKAQLEKALIENPSSIKQIPAALLAMVEDDGPTENLDKEEFTDSESEDDEDDLKYKVFDKKKFKNRRESTLNPPKLSDLKTS